MALGRPAGGNSPENTCNAQAESYEPDAPASEFRQGPLTRWRFGLVPMVERNYNLIEGPLTRWRFGLVPMVERNYNLIEGPLTRWRFGLVPMVERNYNLIEGPLTRWRFGLVWPGLQSWVREFLPFALVHRIEYPDLRAIGDRSKFVRRTGFSRLTDCADCGIGGNCAFTQLICEKWI